MKTTNKQQEDCVIEIQEVTQGRMTVYLLFNSPLVINRMAAKAKRAILLPPQKLTKQQRGSTLKHKPYEEFRDSAHQLTTGPTLLALPSTCFKKALSTAALDIPGAAKSVIGRLTYVEGQYVPIYGIPQFYMTVVRSADINRTPDIRTRVIVPRWAAKLTICYITPLLREKPILNLLTAAGMSIGVGDGRPEKGTLTFGQFQIVSADNQELQEIMTYSRDAQIVAMDKPDFYDAESSELYSWYREEVKKRGFILESWGGNHDLMEAHA